MRVEWGQRQKPQQYRKKHKISFETSISIFDDRGTLSILDRVVNGEQRWQTLGMVDDIVLVVAHTWKDEEGDEVIRVISARKATPSERRGYAKNQQRPS
jgi:uncharacterized protein